MKVSLEQQVIRTRETEPTAGAINGVGSSRELMGHSGLGEAQARKDTMVQGLVGISEYRLRLFPSEDSWVVGLLQPTALECPWHGDFWRITQIKQNLGRGRAWEEPFCTEGADCESDPPSSAAHAQRRVICTPCHVLCGSVALRVG